MTDREPKIIAVPGTTPELDAPMESKFGRAALLLLVDAETMAFEALENPARNASGGAGIEAAELLSKKGVKGLIAEKLGPKAEAALSAAGIPLYECPATGSVREALERFRAGELPVTSAGPPRAETERDDFRNAPPGAEGEAGPSRPVEGGRGSGTGRGMGGGRGRGGGRGVGGGGGGGQGGGQGKGRGMGGGGKGGQGGGRGGGGRGTGRSRGRG